MEAKPNIPHPVAMDGHSTPQVCCPFTGWTSFLHLKRCWSWFRVAAPLGVQQDDAHARPMACLALMCASAPGPSVKTFNALGMGETKMT